MTQRIPGNFSTVDWSLVATMGNTMPPRDPNDDDDDDGNEDSNTLPPRRLLIYRKVEMLTGISLLKKLSASSVFVVPM